MTSRSNATGMNPANMKILQIMIVNSLRMIKISNATDMNPAANIKILQIMIVKLRVTVQSNATGIKYMHIKTHISKHLNHKQLLKSREMHLSENRIESTHKG